MAGAAVMGLVLLAVVLGVPGFGRAISGELWLYQAHGTGVPNFETAEDTTPIDCWGVNGYEDVADGGQIRLLDGSGAVLATAALDEAHLDIDVFGQGAFCGFRFGFKSVPDKDFYTVVMGRRGELSYSREELADAEWTVKLILGP